MAHAAQNEKTKLTATFFNTIGIACVVVGVVTPLAGYAYGGQLGFIGSWRSIVLLWVWILSGGALHVIGRRVLSRIRE
jgi:hypothetical protein